MRLLFAAVLLTLPSAARAAISDPWDAALKARSEAGFVDYAAWKKDRAGLDRYLEGLRKVPAEEELKWPRARRLAFWINAYNAFTVAAVLDRYPIRRGWSVAALAYPENSIKQIGGVFDRIEHEAAGRRLTLDALENDILRGELADPRIHFAIVCASIGCPPLRAEAYREETLDAQLEDQIRVFLASDRVRIDLETRTVRLSKIFKWFGADFERFAAPEFAGLPEAARGPLSFFGDRIDAKTRAALRDGKFSLSWLPYDWSLNDRPRPPARR